MKLATPDQLRKMKVKLEATSIKPQASGHKHKEFFHDPCFKDPDVWYNIWLDGLIEYLEQRLKRQASS